MAAKIAERLFIVGLPVAESIRCKLFAGLCISSANDSNPTVALTKSRKINLAVLGSPSRNSEIASSNELLPLTG